MKIWITGSKGMLGSHFIRLLQQRRLEYVGTDNAQSENPLDITQLDSVLDFISKEQITHVINCAAYTQVDRAEAERSLAHQVNVIGPKNLGIASKRLGVRLLHFSTDYVFNGLGNAPYEEDHPCAPVNYYGLTKWEGDKQILEQGVKGCVLRTSWLFGWPGKNFVETMLRLMQEKETLRIVVDQIGRPTYAGDLAEAALSLLDRTGIYHFANHSETSWYHFAKEIYRQGKDLGLPLTVKEITPIPTQGYPTPAKRPAYSTLSTKKIEGVLGKVPRTWQEALKVYISQYHLSHLLLSQPKV